MMVFYACCNKFPKYNINDLNMICAESYSLGNSGVCHLINNQQIEDLGGYIQNIKKNVIFKFYGTFSFQNDL